MCDSKSQRSTTKTFQIPTISARDSNDLKEVYRCCCYFIVSSVFLGFHKLPLRSESTSKRSNFFSFYRHRVDGVNNVQGKLNMEFVHAQMENRFDLPNLLLH